ncbi:MAG: aminotransferase class IV, partial [Myxococcota bacterium]
DAILLDSDGHICEGGYCAIVWWSDGVLHVPASARTLPSITKAIILDEARRRGGRIYRSNSTPSALEGKEVWAVNALHGITVVTKIVTDSILRTGTPTVADHWRRWLDDSATELKATP